MVLIAKHTYSEMAQTYEVKKKGPIKTDYDISYHPKYWIEKII